MKRRRRHVGHFSSAGTSASLLKSSPSKDPCGCGRTPDEPDCTGLCLLLTFLVITVFVIIVIVIIIFFFLPTITQLIVCRSNGGTCEVS